MKSNAVRNVTGQDIETVKNLIERCMQLYMTQKEVVSKLQNEAKIEPEFTNIIWHKLEEQNPEVFKSYYTKLVLKKQIEEFNKLLEKQKQLMDSEQTKIAPLPTSNGIHDYHDVSPMPHSNNGTNIFPRAENPACYYTSTQTPEGLNPNNMQYGVESNLPNVFNNGGGPFGMVYTPGHGDIPSMAYSKNVNGGSSYGNVDMPVNRDIQGMPYSKNTNGGSSYGNVDMPVSGDNPIMPYSTNANGGSSYGNVDMPVRGDNPIMPYSTNANGVSSYGNVDMPVSGDNPIMPYSTNTNGGSSYGNVDMPVNGYNPIMHYSKNANGRLSYGEADISVNGYNPIMHYSKNANGGSSYGKADIPVNGYNPIMHYSKNTNGGSSYDNVDMPVDGDIPTVPYSHNPNLGLQKGINEEMTILEPNHSSYPHVFGANGNDMAIDTNVGNASTVPITGVESNSHLVNKEVNIPRTFSNGLLSRSLSLQNLLDLTNWFPDNHPEAPSLDFNYNIDYSNFPEIEVGSLLDYNDDDFDASTLLNLLK